MTVKDFKVGDEVIYLDFNDRSSVEQATIKTGYVKYVGRKVVRVGKFKTEDHKAEAEQLVRGRRKPQEEQE